MRLKARTNYLTSSQAGGGVAPPARLRAADQRVARQHRPRRALGGQLATGTHQQPAERSTQPTRDASARLCVTARRLPDPSVGAASWSS